MVVPQKAARFEFFQRVMPRRYLEIEIEQQGFEIVGGPRFEAGQNQACCLILMAGFMHDWQIWRVSIYFAEYAKYVKATPFGHDFPELRALLRHKESKLVSEVVRFF